MFSEQWQLDTQPVLNGGSAIRVLLKGLALQEDLNAEKRAALEEELGQRQMRNIVQSILDEILDGVRSPERAVSPIDAYVTVCSCLFWHVSSAAFLPWSVLLSFFYRPAVCY